MLYFFVLGCSTKCIDTLSRFAQFVTNLLLLGSRVAQKEADCISTGKIFGYLCIHLPQVGITRVTHYFIINVLVVQLIFALKSLKTCTNDTESIKGKYLQLYQIAANLSLLKQN